MSFDEKQLYKSLESAIFQRKRAIDSLREGVAISDPNLPDNPIVYINDAFVDMTGYSKEESLGKNCRFLQGDDTAPEALDKIRSAIQQEEAISIELLNYRKDGRPFWNHITISPVYNDHSELVNFVAIQRDVTALRSDMSMSQNKIEALEKAVQLLKERVTEQEDTIASFIMHRNAK